MEIKQNKTFQIANLNPFSVLAFLCVAAFILTQYALISIPGITVLFMGSVFLYMLGNSAATKGIVGSYFGVVFLMIIYILFVDLLDHPDPASDGMRRAMIYQILYCLAIYLYCMMNKKNIGYLLWFVIISLAIFSVSILTDEAFLEIIKEGAEKQEHFTKDETNRNTIGMLLGFGSLFFFHFAMTKNKLFIIPMILVTFLGLLTGSRKAIFAALFGTIIYSFLHIRNYKGKHKKGIGLILLVLLILVALLYLCYTNETLYNIIGHRIEGMFGAWFGGESQETSAVIRSQMVEKAMQMFWEKPIFGWGIEGFALNSGYGVYSHNNYTEVLANYGIIGFIVFYLFKFVILVKQFSLLNRSNVQEEISLNIFLTVWLIVAFMLDFGAISINSLTNNIVFAVAAAQQMFYKRMYNIRGERL